MALFRIHLVGVTDQPLVELEARDVRDLQAALGPARFIRGRVVCGGDEIEVLIPVSRIQLITEVAE